MNNSNSSNVRPQDIIDIDSDSDESDISSHIPSSDTLEEKDLPTMIEEFRERCLNGLPVNLMTADFKNHLFFNSNRRLEEAKASGVSLNDIIVGDDCLPTWSGSTWDPAVESLHDTIQSRLATRDEAQQAGILGAAAEEAIRFLHHDNEDDRNTPADQQDGTSSVDDFYAAQMQDIEGVWPYEAATLDSPADSSSMALSHPYSSDSGSDSDSESEPDNSPDEEDFDDTFSVDIMFDPEADYPDSGNEEPNIFHSARVLSVPSQYANVDLEIYEADDEDELEDLPEMELCVDGELYEALFNTEEAVDVEIEGSRLICTGALFEEGEEMTLDNPEDINAVFGVQGDEDGLDLEISKGGVESQMFRQRVGSGDEPSNGPLSSSWENTTGEQTIYHETTGNVVWETEDGFAW
ncbi:hypothetical protein FLONG3_10860 [Fusarium longipes]|uniref:Uncharacterized protein n=1 Tax=Fusarium longipes TaxID=694270 RepID=A0A395RJX3_9HYPO|nr:hypothetical protein FLONG3_10860 [Fusarium longipes]